MKDTKKNKIQKIIIKIVDREQNYENLPRVYTGEDIQVAIEEGYKLGFRSGRNRRNKK